MYNPRILILLLPRRSSILNIKIESQPPTVAHQPAIEGGVISGANGLVILVGGMAVDGVAVQTMVVASRTLQLWGEGSMLGPCLTLLSVVFFHSLLHHPKGHFLQVQRIHIKQPSGPMSLHPNNIMQCLLLVSPTADNPFIIQMTFSFFNTRHLLTKQLPYLKHSIL